MAKRTAYTLSPQLATDLPAVVRRVKQDGGSTAVTPYKGRIRDLRGLYLEITDWDGAPYRNVYIVEVWNAFEGGTRLTSETEGAQWHALNMSEKDDGPASGGYDNRSGYRVVPEEDAVCGNYIGIEDVPNDRRHPVLDYRYYSGVDHVADGWYFLFDFRADPQVKGADS